jgi:hypothetical protein
MKNLKSYLTVTFIAGSLPNVIYSSEQPPDQATYGNSPLFQQMTLENKGVYSPKNAYLDQVSASSTVSPQMLFRGQQGSTQGFQQNPGAFGGQGVNFNPNAGVPATSPQGFQQNPGAFGGQGMNFNPNAGVPATSPQG